MKKIIMTGFVLAGAIALSGCSMTNEKEDTMRLEGMMPKEDNKTIDAMMKKTEGNDAMMQKEESADDVMMKQ